MISYYYCRQEPKDERWWMNFGTAAGVAKAFDEAPTPQVVAPQGEAAGVSVDL